MSDLIERLRTIHATATMREAADEIERLRLELIKTRAIADGHLDAWRKAGTKERAAL